MPTEGSVGSGMETEKGHEPLKYRARKQHVVSCCSPNVFTTYHSDLTITQRDVSF